MKNKKKKMMMKERKMKITLNCLCYEIH